VLLLGALKNKGSTNSTNTSSDLFLFWLFTRHKRQTHR